MEKRRSHTKQFVARLVGMLKGNHVSVTVEDAIMDWVTNKKAIKGMENLKMVQTFNVSAVYQKPTEPKNCKHIRFLCRAQGEERELQKVFEDSFKIAHPDWQLEQISLEAEK